MDNLPPAEGSAASRFLSNLREQTGKPTASESGASMATVEFRCAKTGEKFVAILIRHSENHKFAIQSMIKADQTGASIKDAVHAATLNTVKTTNVDDSDTNWSGWYCPCCNYRSTPELNTHFLRCGTCSQLVCGGRCHKLEDGGEMFACHNGCGGGGKTSGSIDSYQAVQSGVGRLDGGGKTQRRLEQ